MTKGPVLILGGGTYQLPLVHAVKRRGLRAVVFDGDPGSPGLALADEGHVVDISRSALVIEAARALRPCAVASIAAEVAVRATAETAAALGLPGLPLSVAELSTDKYLMRRCFAEAGLESPRFALLERESDAERLGAEVGYPLVTKPVDSSGSRGVRRVDDASGIREAVRDALQHSRNGRAIAESFLDGVECTVEALAFAGEIQVLGMSDKIRVPFPACVSVSLTYPPYFDAATQRAIAEAARGAIRAVGMQSGPAHVEVMVTPSGVFVVEMAARGGGYRIYSDIMRELSGVDPVEATLDMALGLTPSIRPTRERAAVLRFFQPPSVGVLRAVSGVKEAKRLPGVFDVVIEAAIGATFRGISRDGERPGYVISVADSREEAVRAADLAERTVRFDFMEGESDATEAT